MAEKNWPKSAKKSQKEPKFVFRAQAPLPAPRLPAEGNKQRMQILIKMFCTIPPESSQNSKEKTNVYNFILCKYVQQKRMKSIPNFAIQK